MASKMVSNNPSPFTAASPTWILTCQHLSISPSRQREVAQCRCRQEPRIRSLCQALHRQRWAHTPSLGPMLRRCRAGATYSITVSQALHPVHCRRARRPPPLAPVPPSAPIPVTPSPQTVHTPSTRSPRPPWIPWAPPPPSRVVVVP